MADKKQRKNRRVVKMNEMYDQGKAKNQTCPKCGPGVFMANHGNRNSCGKCGYSTFGDSKKPDAPVDETPVEKPEEKAPEPEKTEESPVEEKEVEETPEPEPAAEEPSEEKAE